MYIDSSCIREDEINDESASCRFLPLGEVNCSGRITREYARVCGSVT